VCVWGRLRELDTMPNWEWLIPTLLGGLLAIVGGLGLSRLQRRLEARRRKAAQQHQVGVAIDAVLSELARNHSMITGAIASEEPAPELRVSYRAYERGELLLAEWLPVPVQEALFQAYRPLRAGNLFKNWVTTSAQGMPPGHRELDFAECQAELRRLTQATDELRRAQRNLRRPRP
jgi:hypothetical protein